MAKVSNAILVQCVANKEKVGPKEVEFLKADFSTGSKPEEGYVCDLIAVDLVASIHGQEKELHFMVKTLPKFSYKQKFAKEINAIEKECITYSKIIPGMQKILKEAGLRQLNVPACYYTSIEDGLIVMENIKLKGFQCSIRDDGSMTLEEIKLLMRELALFHSASYHYLQEYPEAKFRTEMSIFCQDGFLQQDDRNRDVFSAAVVRKFFLSSVDIYKSCEGYDLDVAKKLDQLAQDRDEKVLEVIKPSSTGFNVICHNDVHNYNVMFRNTDSLAKEICILDLQLLKRTRPVVDLTYFLGTSTGPEFRKAHLDDLLKYYHEELMSNLTTIGYNDDIYTLQQLHKDMDECYLNLFDQTFVVTQLFMNNSFEMKATENLADDNKQWDDLFESLKNNPPENLKQRLMSTVTEAIEKGLL